MALDADGDRGIGDSDPGNDDGDIRPMRRDILIGGAGLSASAAAIRLCQLEFRPLVAVVAVPSLPGIEAIPESAWPFITHLDLHRALREAGAAVVHGFENHWVRGAPVTLPGRWLHVDRNRFAAAALREAIRRGARVRALSALPSLNATPESVTCHLEGRETAFGAAIDATGRAAIWSRPVQRGEAAVADLFDCAPGCAPRGRVVNFGREWAYRIGDGRRVSAGIVSAHGQRWQGKLTAPRSLGAPDIWEALGLESSDRTWCGRRAAAHQWCQSPVDGRRIAIGDAAHAYGPLAGQGIRFGLASAWAAASVLQTWNASPDATGRAARFYDRFVRQCHRRHRRWLGRLPDAAAATPDRSAVPEWLVFAGSTSVVDVNVDSRIVSDQAARMSDDEHVRWIGGIDVLAIRELTLRPIRSASLIDALIVHSCTRRHAEAVVAWCVEQQLLSDAETSIANPAVADPPGSASRECLE